MSRTQTPHPRSTLRKYASRASAPLVLLGMLILLANVIFSLSIGIVGVSLVAAGVALLFVRTEHPHHDAVTVSPPLRGSWVAFNSPADKVPSHGTRELGQAYAIDLLYQPEPEVTWQPVHRWPPARRASSFPGYGRPIYAPADGVVVKATDWQRDHMSRNSPYGLAYIFPEMLVRALLSGLGGHFVLGNHVVLDLGDGVYAAFAHLRRGSVRVRPGTQVRTGDQLAECGNSGNTSEPHLHFQLMDHRRPALAAGVPFSFDGYEVDGQLRSGVPRNSESFTATPAH